MRRTITALMILGYAMPLLLPAVVMVRFQLQRERIVKELCVQRAVPEGKRSCHGQCHLKKQLEQGGAEKGTPAAPRLTLRIDPVQKPIAARWSMAPTATDRSFGHSATPFPLEGHAYSDDPVPWG